MFIFQKCKIDFGYNGSKTQTWNFYQEQEHSESKEAQLSVDHFAETALQCGFGDCKEHYPLEFRAVVIPNIATHRLL